MRIENLQKLYDDYLDKAFTVERNRKPGEGIFGIGKKPSDDPCHVRFLEDLKDWLERFAGEEPDSSSVRDVLTLIYRAPKENPEPMSAYWMLIAAQGPTAPLIPRLSGADAAALNAEFAAAYKRWERMPVQNEILKALAQAAKQNTDK